MFGIEFSTKKFGSAYVYLPSKVELGGSKNWHIRSSVMQGNSKLHSIQSATQPKIRILRKKVQIKVVRNYFLQKSPQEHILSLLRVELGGLERLICLKYDIVLKCQIAFNLGLSVAKNTQHTKKASIKSSSELNFVQKSPRAHMFISSKSGTRGLERSLWLNIILY